MIVGTPGRTLDFLEKGHFFFHNCRQMCLDEADRMIDLGFEENLRGILSHSKHKIQMLLFSATMPNSIKEFAMKALNNPILINVGRAGAANLNIVQEVELVDKNRRLEAILEALQKTAPPVSINCSFEVLLILFRLLYLRLVRVKLMMFWNFYFSRASKQLLFMEVKRKKSAFTPLKASSRIRKMFW